MSRKRPGANDIRGSNYNGQFNSPSHMLSLADVKALQEDSQVGGKIKLGKFAKDFSKGFAIGFNGVMNSAPAKMVVGHALNKAMTGYGYDTSHLQGTYGRAYNPYMSDVNHLEGAGLGSMMKKVGRNKMVKGLTKAAVNSAVPIVSNAISARTGLDPSLSKALTRSVANQVNEQVIGSGFGSFVKKAVNNKVVKGLAKQAVNAAVPAISTGLTARTGLDPSLTRALTKAAATGINNQIGSGISIGVYNKGKRTRRKASPGDKRARRGKLVSHLMKSEGMTLAQASRYIKDNGIEY